MRLLIHLHVFTSGPIIRRAWHPMDKEISPQLAAFSLYLRHCRPTTSVLPYSISLISHLHHYKYVFPVSRPPTLRNLVRFTPAKITKAEYTIQQTLEPQSTTCQHLKVHRVLTVQSKHVCNARAGRGDAIKDFHNVLRARTRSRSECKA